MPPWQPAQLKPPSAVVAKSSRPQAAKRCLVALDGARLAAGLGQPVERQADGADRQHAEADAAGRCSRRRPSSARRRSRACGWAASSISEPTSARPAADVADRRRRATPTRMTASDHVGDRAAARRSAASNISDSLRRRRCSADPRPPGRWCWCRWAGPDDRAAGVDDDVRRRGDRDGEAVHAAGAGPPFFSPTRLYCEPWHGHSNHCDVSHYGTRQPRCGHFW